MTLDLEREEALLKYLPLVERAARNVRVKSTEYEQEDLVNIGFIGLMDAYEKFDKSKEIPFENYAYIRIKGSIIDEIRRNASVPRSQIDRLNEFYRAKEELEQKLEREPTEQEVVKKLGITDKQLRSLHQTLHNLSRVSLDEVLFDEDLEGLTRIAYLEDDKKPQIEEQLMQKELHGVLKEAITLLTKREQTLLQLYYEEELAFKDIAYILDVSAPRISQIHGKILEDLRVNIKQIMKDEGN